MFTRLKEYDIYYVEWLHNGQWVADTILIQKDLPPEPYCEEMLTREWTHATTNAKTKRDAYRLVKLLPDLADV